MHLWISEQPEHLVSHLVTALEIPQSSVSHHLRRLEHGEYVNRRRGGAIRMFTGQFNGGDSGSGYGPISRADRWSITDKGKVKAEELAAERD